MDLSYRDRALVFEDVLVLADLHVGKSASANLDVPVGDTSDVITRFEALVDAYDPATVVVAGDVLHSFETVPRTVETTVAALAEIGSERGTSVVVTPGNHDSLLDSVWDGPTPSEYCVGETVILHGHEPPVQAADRYVIGHDHPTIVIDGGRRPCYLYGEDAYDGADVVMLPSFNRSIRGVQISEMNASDFRSPLVRNVEDFRPIVRDESSDETTERPPLGESRRVA